MQEYRLFPPISISRSAFLNCGDVHQVYWEETGNLDGIPVIFLHGGPGAGTQAWHRQFFNPEKYRIILMDQRGCGRSRPFAEIKENKTQNLVADLEQLRQHLDIEKWVVFGGSWGSTLALVYAETHPDRCLGLILRGVFLATQAEKDWFMRGMQNFFPEISYQFQTAFDVDPADLLPFYYEKLQDPDPEIHRLAAYHWFSYESSCATLIPSAPTPYEAYSDEMLALARLEAHYFYHDFFLAPDQIIQNSAALKDLPIMIVQGRYDVICPPVSAWRLTQYLANAHLTFINDAGHSSGEPGIQQALIQATEVMWQSILAD